MNKATNTLNIYSDKTIEIKISKYRYLIFTLSYKNLIIIEMTNKNNPILLCNKMYKNHKSLLLGLNKFIIISINCNDDEFLNYIDTYIDLKNTIHNEIINEILSTYKIIVEDHDL